MNKVFAILLVSISLALVGCDSSDNQLNERKYPRRDKQINIVKKCTSHTHKIRREWGRVITYIGRANQELKLSKDFGSIESKAYEKYSSRLSNNCHSIINEWQILEDAWLSIIRMIEINSLYSNYPDNETSDGLLMGLFDLLDFKEGPKILGLLKIFQIAKNKLFNGSEYSQKHRPHSVYTDELISQAESRVLHVKRHKGKVNKFLNEHN